MIDATSLKYVNSVLYAMLKVAGFKNTTSFTHGRDYFLFTNTDKNKIKLTIDAESCDLGIGMAHTSSYFYRMSYKNMSNAQAMQLIIEGIRLAPDQESGRF